MDAAVPWRVRDAALLFLLAACVLLMSVLAAQGLYRLQGAPAAVPMQPPPLLTALATDLFYASILTGIWLLVVRRYGIGWAPLGLRLPERDSYLALLGLAVALAVSVLAAIDAVSAVLQSFGLPGRAIVVSETPAPTDPLFAVAVFGSVVLTPVAEELLFRAVLYQSLRQRLGVVFGTIGSAVIFALLHFDAAMIPEFLVLGVVLAIAFERTRSIYPSIVMHAAYNGAILLLAMRVM